MSLAKLEMWKRRKMRIRKKIRGDLNSPRLTVFRSGRHIYAQLINDTSGKTLLSASTLDKAIDAKGSNVESAVKVGKLLGKKAKEAKIEKLVFDRNGYQYHGCVKALSDALREEGLRF